MPLTYLLYRCPRCGHDPTVGEGDEAHCPACDTRFSRGREGGRIRVRAPGDEVWEVSSQRLTAAVDAWNRSAEHPEAAEAALSRAAQVEVRRSAREEPFRFGGELLGFVETLGEAREGVLELSSGALTLWPEGGRGEGPDPVDQWPLLDIRALQTSSSSLQISPGDGGMIQFRFRDDSPRRWEDLLRRVLKNAYRKAGLGEILEFQPRVVTR
jgi:DNA-directed RNA polymerase subunit RPC12/RpoP